MTTIILHLSHYLKNNFKRFNKFNKLSRKLKLTTTKKDVLGNRLIGLDIMKKKLVYLRNYSKKINCIVVNLKNLESCSLKKQYDSIEAGGLKHKKLHEYLKSVCLELRFENNPKVMTLSFFEKQKDKLYHLPHLEAKAREWEKTLSSLLSGRVLELA
jgi:hypothetical protein